MKDCKEQLMNDRLTARFEEGFKQIKSSLSKERGIKQEGAVNRRIGRLQQKYPSVSKLHTTGLQADETGTVTEITCERSKSGKAFGVYFIRCSPKRLTEELIWEIYSILREIESTFRCLKKQGIHHNRRRIRNIMSSQTVVTTRMKLENRDSLILRNVTRPNQEQTKIYRASNFKQTNPKMRKKAVVPLK